MHCEASIRQSITEKEELHTELTVDSLKALEKQCNKLCIKKMIRAYTYQSQLVMGKFNLAPVPEESPK